jgi:cobalt-zinc-cadmium efflux system membrane fusion protein
MKIQQWIINLVALFFIAVLAIVGFKYLQTTPNAELSSSHSESDSEHTEDFTKGLHGGRLLEKDSFQVEVAIFEHGGTPPKFRIYFYDNGTPINPSNVNFEMELRRINRVEKIPFKNVDSYLESTIEASEPHSFKVIVDAKYKDKNYDWEYDSFEGRVELTPEAINANNIKIEVAGPINLEIKLDVIGKIIPDDESTVYITPRFPGMVKSVNKKLGDHVHKGDVLAVIESNESLKNYDVKSEIDGMIIKKNINLGMYLSGQENIFVISNQSSVWADFHVYRQDIAQISLNDPIKITTLDGSLSQQSTISYISPLGQETTQSVLVRAVLDNAKETWKPGLFVSGEITVENVPVALAIKDAALQTFRDWDIVFIAIDNVFELVPVKIGKSNKEWVEIKSGLKPGDHYVSDNSFILKADVEKSGATHEH